MGKTGQLASLGIVYTRPVILSVRSTPRSVLKIPTFWFCFIATFGVTLLTPWFARIGRSDEQSLTILGFLYVSGDVNGTLAYHNTVFIVHTIIATLIAVLWTFKLDRNSGRHQAPKRFGIIHWFIYFVFASVAYSVVIGLKFPTMFALLISIPMLTYPCVRAFLPVRTPPTKQSLDKTITS